MKQKVFVNRRITGKKSHFHLEGGRQYFDSIINSLRAEVSFTNNNEEARIVHLFGGFIEPYIYRKIISSKPSLLSLTLSPPDSFIKKIPRDILARIYMKKMSRTLTVSEYQKNYLEKKGLKNVDKLGVFINHEHFKPMRTEKNEKFTVAYAGSLNKDKGASELYRTAKTLENKNIIFKLAIRSCDSALENIYKKLTGIKNTAIYKNTDMLKLFNSSDMIFLPFKTVYGTFPMPYTLLEAMSCGKPVLTTDIEPLREIINDGKNGFLANKEKFSQKILEISNMKTKNIGINARKYILKNHDKKPLIKKLLSVYEEFV